MLKEILREQVPGVEVRVYGSRVSAQSHAVSNLEEALRLSTNPFLVEARDWACLSESFHREIDPDYVVLK
ncbi:MAG: hypothetical protein OXH73_11630 [Caldilineaceae bacterium]|nr:hypothetical protein [Caldilineaceae bacterium]